MGTISVMVSGAVFVAMLELGQLYLLQVRSVGPFTAGIMFWPNVVAAAMAAILFGLLLPTRWLFYLVPAGIVALGAAAFLLTTVSAHGSLGVMYWAAAALGLGAGLTVSPGLFVAALAISSKLVGRTFALVELLRSAATYLLAPVLSHFALVYGRRPAELAYSLHIEFWLVLGVTAAGLLLILAIFFGAGVKIAPPAIDAWLGGKGQAVESPDLLASAQEHPQA
jgi:hypothetical protein